MYQGQHADELCDSTKTAPSIMRRLKNGSRWLNKRDLWRFSVVFTFLVGVSRTTRNSSSTRLALSGRTR